MGNLILIPIIFGVMFVLYTVGRWRGFAWMNALFWVVVWWVGLYFILKYAVAPPLPASIVQMFMAIITIALLFYIASDSQKLRETTGPIVRFIVDRKFKLPLTVVTLLIPLLVAWNVYLGMQTEIVAPVFGRSIHPAPPSQFSYEGKNVNLAELGNPYRKLETDDPQAFLEHVKNGRKVYYDNCVFCHGDTLEGNGLYAHGFNPIPANLADSGTIAQLQENYVFWRVAKGGPDLPDESGPWSSAMPAWEKFLTEEEIWNVIMFIYHFTNTSPRADMELAH